MHVFDDVTTCTCSLPKLVLTIGSFDGMHRGHQYILKTVIQTAEAQGGSAGLMSLWPHPRTLLNPESAPPLLSTPSEKRRLLEEIGLDAYFVLPFNKTIAEMDREAFIRDIVIGKCGAQTLIVGHDFSFGAGARGDFSYLQSAGARGTPAPTPGGGGGTHQQHPDSLRSECRRDGAGTSIIGPTL